MAIQSVEVRFEGEKLATHTGPTSTNTLYRTPEGLYRVHMDEGEIAFLESGLDGEDLLSGKCGRSGRSCGRLQDCR
jgi:hypothetical protein